MRFAIGDFVAKRAETRAYTDIMRTLGGPDLHLVMRRHQDRSEWEYFPHWEFFYVGNIQHNIVYSLISLSKKYDQALDSMLHPAVWTVLGPAVVDEED